MYFTCLTSFVFYLESRNEKNQENQKKKLLVREPTDQPMMNEIIMLDKNSLKNSKNCRKQTNIAAKETKHQPISNENPNKNMQKAMPKVSYVFPYFCT